MDNADVPSLEVGFTINAGTSFEELRRLQAFMHTAEFKALKSAESMEGAFNRLNFTGAKVQVEGFGTVATQQMGRVEKSADRLTAQLNRQIETFGKTASQVRQIRVDKLAADFDRLGNSIDADKLRALNAELVRLETAGLRPIGATGQLATHHMQNLAFQFQDLGIQMVAAAGSSAPFKMAMMAAMQQGAQISGIMSQANVGIKAVGAAFVTMSKNVLLATVSNPYLLAFAVAVGTAAAAVNMLKNAANSGVDMKAYATSIGVSTKEMRHLTDVSVTFGDTAKAVFQVAGRYAEAGLSSVGDAIWGKIGPAVTDIWDVMREWLDWIGTNVRAGANAWIGGFVGAFQVITTAWRQFPAVMGDVFFSAVNAAIGAINSLVQKSVSGVNGFIQTANTILSKAGMELPQLSAPQIDAVKNQFAGAGAKFGTSLRAEMTKAMGKDYVGALGRGARAVGREILDQAADNARKRIREQAEKKGYLDPTKGKTDHHAEQLAREAAAIEAQIRNLYALAEAYNVSGAAALVAEARVKAESSAIKKRGDIEAMVAQQIRLAVAQRVSDTAKSTAALRDQATVQADVNGEVAAGIIPAERAADIMRERIAELPLLAAIEVAQQRGLRKEADAATAALLRQREAQATSRGTELAAKFNLDDAAMDRQLALLTEELRLVGATTAVRERGLAALRATQNAELVFGKGTKFATDNAAKQMQVYDATVATKTATDDLNAALSFTADKWDIIGQNVGNAARGMADAFGSVGRAIGDTAAIYADFRAQQERELAVHKQTLLSAKSQSAIDRENTRFALRNSTAQIGMYGDMAQAARGFFKEKSAGYKAVMAAEKVFRAFEFAMSVQAMVQNAAETLGFVTNSAARATAAGTEGIANQSKLPFPFNIAAMAATGAALLAAGVAVLSGGRGGGASNYAAGNTGTGTVLGDRAAKSESLSRAIEQLREVDTVTSVYARQMAASLRSIDNQIGGLASVLVRSGNLSADDQVAQGFKPNAIGSVLGSIPLIGGFLGSLFGTKTKVIGSGIYGGDMSLADILAGGYSAQTYSDVQKKKKFLGLTTSTKYSTVYGSGLDSSVTDQFALILKSFNDAILAAAGPLGATTDEITAKLSGFVFGLGKIDLTGLSGTEIQEKLAAVFGAAADQMALTAFPGMSKFQKVGEGAFETLVRVASTVEAVTDTLDQFGMGLKQLSIDAKVALADQFDTISDFSSAAQDYFATFYTRGEQATARAAQLTKVFGSMNLAMPTTLAAFRALVEAQDLTTASGQSNYATLLKLGPAFADLLGSLGEAKTAADAADDLREAWKSVGDDIMDEVKRIRSLTGSDSASFASLQGQFNAATEAARGGDQAMAKALPGLSQSLLAAAEKAAMSRQELERIRAQTAASLEDTYASVMGRANAGDPGSITEVLDRVTAAQAATTQSATDQVVEQLQAMNDNLADELQQLRDDTVAGFAAVAGGVNKSARILDDAANGGGGLQMYVAQQ